MGCVYRPPNSDISEFNIELDAILSKVRTKRDQLLLVTGDFNLDLLSVNTHQPTLNFINTMSSHSLYPTIHNPTRVTNSCSTLLDNIFINSVKLEFHSAVVYSDISDHYPVVLHLIINNPKNKLRPPLIKTRSYHPNAINAFNSHLSGIDWEPVYEILGIENDLNKAYNSFLELYTHVFNTHFPLKSRKKANKMTPRNEWITRALMKSCRTKALLYKKYCQDRSSINKEIYVKYRNKLNALIRKAEKDFYSEKFKSAIGNMKITWRLISSVLKSKSKPSISEYFIAGGIRIENKQEIVDRFNEYFGSIGSQLASAIPQADKHFTDYLTTPKVNSFSFFPTDPQEILRITSDLNNKISSGWDEIPVTILKSSIAYIAYPLSLLINCSLTSGIFPEALKIGKICPIFKCGDKSLFSNYRPISILPSFSKIFEKVIHNRLSSYLYKENIITDQQFGFRKNHSTYMAIMDFYDVISNAVDKNEFAIAIFVDLAKAFDTIDYNIMLQKLSYYGIRGIALDLFESYLSNRKQFLYSSGLSSPMINVTHGVPQGSILGPLLFNIYINDIVNCSSILRLILFADDTTLINSDKNFDTLIKVTNDELAKLSIWFKVNKLSVNVSKTNFILFGSKHYPSNTSYSVLLNDKCLDRVNCTKFLGVYIDEKLTWNDHINHVCSKVSIGLGIIGRLKLIFPVRILMSLYYSLIYPYLCYCCIIWGNSYDATLHSIVVLQNRAVRILTNSPYRLTANPLFNQLKLLQIKDLCNYQILLFMYQTRYVLLPHTCQHYCVPNDVSRYATRKPSYFTLFTCRTNVRKKSICISGPKLWNTIPPELLTINSLPNFKLALKSWYIEKYV
jgi:hypothetical protein